MSDFLPMDIDNDMLENPEDELEQSPTSTEEAELADNEPRRRHRTNVRVTIHRGSTTSNQRHLRTSYKDPDVAMTLSIGETLELNDSSYVKITGFGRARNQWTLVAELSNSHGVAGGNRSLRSSRRGSEEGEPGDFVVQPSQEHLAVEITATDVSHSQHHPDNDQPEASPSGRPIRPKKRARAEGRNRGKGRQHPKDPRGGLALAPVNNGDRVVKATGSTARTQSLYTLATSLGYTEIPPLPKDILGKSMTFLVKNYGDRFLRSIAAAGSRWVRGQ